MAKITPEQRKEIKRRVLAGERNCDVAREFHVTAATISQITGRVRSVLDTKKRNKNPEKEKTPIGPSDAFTYHWTSRERLIAPNVVPGITLSRLMARR